MSGLLIVATKYRTTPHLIKFNNGQSVIIRSLALAAQYCGIKFDSLQSTIVSKHAKKSCLSYSRQFSASSPSSTKANLDTNNILRSPFPDIHGFTGVYVHDFVFDKLGRWPDKTALVCSATGRAYTYAETRKLCGRLATSLRRSKLRPGDMIAAVLPNIPEYAILIMAASEAGLRITVINPAYTSGEVGAQLKNSNAVAVFTVPSKHSIVATSIADNPNVRLPLIMVEDGNGSVPEGTIKFADLIKDGIEEFSKTGEKSEIDPEDTFLLPYSSGTSGLPKGVELSHRNIVANLIQISSKGISVSNETTATYQDILPIILPIYHIYGLLVVLGLYMWNGSKLICVPQFTPENFFKVLEENRSTLLYLAPPLVQLLANDKRVKKHHLETIRTVCSGAAPIGEEVLAKFFTRAPPSLKVVQGYGLTECSPVISMGSDTPSASTGHVVPSTEVRMVGYEDGDVGKNLGVNEVGEIFIRGPQVMKGYYKNPKATADCMEGDWFKTGDLGCFDENGHIYIRGRLKELIKVKGFQVAPAEIEDLIQGHPKVLDAAVIGVPHEKYGEIPKAFVVPKSGTKLEADEIKGYIAERVAKYKQLGHVEFIERIPKSAAGKILRRELQKI